MKLFPWGHATLPQWRMAAGLVLIHLGRAQGRRWLEVVGGILVIIGPLIGLSRLVLGVHWPTDILAGWLLGGAVACAAAAAVLWWAARPVRA